MGDADRRVRDARRFLENFEDMAAHLRPGEPVPHIGGIEGTDPTSTVYCVVQLDGTLSQVGIVDGWWDAVGPGGVASAVLDALGFAREKATMARLVLDRYGHPYQAATPDPSTLFTSEPSRPLPPYDAPDFQDALVRKVNRAATILANVERFTQARDSAERRVVTGPRGMFRVILTGFTIVGAEVSEHGLHPSDAADLAQDARDALLAARPSFSNHGEDR
jgi:hypothetical protein